MDKLALSSGPYRAVATLDGGGLLEFSRQEEAGLRHILRPASQEPSGPLDRAMIVMAPWCNRIGGGGFTSGDRFQPIAPNVSGFPRKAAPSRRTLRSG
jgi:aldose 1-epimerase